MKKYGESAGPCILRRTTAANVTANAITATLTPKPIENNLLVAVMVTASVFANINSVPAGWTAAVHQDRSTANTSIWYKVAGAAEPTDTTFGFTASVLSTLMLLEIRGIATAAPLDQVVSTDGGAGAVTGLSTGTTPATTQADEIAIAGWGQASSGAAYGTPTNNFRQAAAVGSSARLTAAAAILTATGTVESTVAWVASRVSTAVLATFKAA